MAGELQLGVGTTPALAANYVKVYADTADKMVKTIDANGVISILNNDGLQDMNVLTNGGFTIQQRVATAATAIPSVSTTTRAGQVADRWAVTTGNVTTTLWTQVDTGAAVEALLQSKHYGKITQNTNPAKFILSQFLANEDIAHLRGKKVQVSVKIKQFAGANANYRLGLLQLAAAGTIDVCPTFISAIGGASVEPTWGANLVAITPDASPVGEHGTISGVALTITSTSGWIRSSCVFTVPTDAKNLCVVLYRDTIGAASDALGVAEFQMTQGSDIVDYIALSRSIELKRCLRYFCKSFPQTVVPAAALAVATAGFGYTGILGKAGSGTVLGSQISIQFFNPMWKTPAVTLFTPVGAGAVVYRHNGTTPLIQGATTVLASSITDRGCVVTATNEATVNGAVGDLVGIHFTADAEFLT